MSWINKLQDIPMLQGGTSQYGEHQVIDEIFKNIDPMQRAFVDIGAGDYSPEADGSAMSNTRHLYENGWTGIGFDYRSDRNYIKMEFVTPDNVVKLFRKYGVHHFPDFLNIDIDGFDLDVLEAAMAYMQPAVICTEYNATLDPNISVKLQYEEGYTWDGTNKYGYSFAAGMKFADKHGYAVVLNHMDMNLFMVHKDRLSTDDLWNLKITARLQNHHPVNPNAVWVEY